MRWSELVDSTLEEQLVQWRRHFHANPELGFEERETTAYIANLLEGWGIEVGRPLETGVVGYLKGGRPGPIVAVRADIDALPVQEQNDFEYASRAPGKMHACGHDGHTAILLGVAKAMATVRDQIAGEVRLLFQPAEERLPGGAVAFTKAGVLDGVSMVLGAHLMTILPTGTVAAQEGALMASTDEFSLTVRGRGGHGAMPHQTIDSVMVGAKLVCDLQTIVSRRVDPLAPAVVTVGTFHAGTAFNIIAEEAVLTGTVRTLSDDVRRQVIEDMNRIVTDGAAAFGASATLEFKPGNPTLVNDPRAAKLLADGTRRVLGDGGLVRIPPMMGGEDFAFYAQRVPSGFAIVGTRDEEARSTYPHHHPRFTIDERSLGIAARIFLEALEESPIRA